MGKQLWKPGNMLYPLPVVMVSLADRDGPVSVGISLDDAKEAAAGWDMAHDGVVVMFQIIHGHIGPGSFECFHIMPRK